MNQDKRVKFAALSPITSDKQVIERLNTIVSTLIPLVGQHSNKYERVVQWSDLMSMGLANVRGLTEDGYPDYEIPTDELPDMTTPPEILNFDGAAGFNFVTLSWDQPRYRNHSYVEVWRAAGFKKVSTDPEVPEVPTVLTDAVFRLMTPSIVCSDSVLPGDKWRYWARNVSQTGVVGPWTSIDGLLMESPEDPAYLIDKISGEIRQGDLWPALGNKIDVAYDGYNTNTSAITSQGQTLASHTQTLASHGIAIQQQSSIITAQGALISAAWTVRIDSGNAVSGFGLMVDGATGRSDFIVRSDRFAISAPQAYDQDGKPVVNNNAFPFIVDVTNPASPKVLIKNAYIDQAFITNLVTGSLIADKIVGQTITGTNIRGGTMAVGSNFSVDGAGNMTALNAFFRGTAQSSGYGAGVSGWQIHNNGNAEFNNAVLRGTIYATGGWFQGTVYAEKLVGGAYTKKVYPSASHDFSITGVWRTATVVRVARGMAIPRTLEVSGQIARGYISATVGSSGSTPETRGETGRFEVRILCDGAVISQYPVFYTVEVTSTPSSGPQQAVRYPSLGVNLRTAVPTDGATHTYEFQFRTVNGFGSIGTQVSGVLAGSAPSDDLCIGVMYIENGDLT